ncbi:hypothetical protein JCM10207_009042 [Rhodosporidiobolus poonsookiae]
MGWGDPPPSASYSSPAPSAQAQSNWSTPQPQQQQQYGPRSPVEGAPSATVSKMAMTSGGGGGGGWSSSGGGGGGGGGWNGPGGGARDVPPHQGGQQGWQGGGRGIANGGGQGSGWSQGPQQPIQQQQAPPQGSGWNAASQGVGGGTSAGGWGASAASPASPSPSGYGQGGGNGYGGGGGYDASNGGGGRGRGGFRGGTRGGNMHGGGGMGRGAYGRSESNGGGGYGASGGGDNAAPSGYGGGSGGGYGSSSNDGYGSGGGGYGGGGGGARASNYESFGPVAPVDFSSIKLPEFCKDFYVPHRNVAERSEADVVNFRADKKITVIGKDVPRPVETWPEANVPDYTVDYIQRNGFVGPTPIQSQAMPMAMSGKDLVAISETGSGKTLAYALPALIHINAQEPTTPDSGPICLVLAPTRELVIQIYKVFKELGESSAIHTACAYGGPNKGTQLRDIQAGCDVVVATPGRLLDFVGRGDLSLSRVTYLVLDEADRMLDMGFSSNISDIVSVIRPDRQVLMFSATWPREVRELAQNYLKTDSRVHIGAEDAHAATKIKQEVRVLRHLGQKRDSLLEELNLVKEANGKALVFASSRDAVTNLTEWLNKERGYSALSLHGGKDQPERDFAMSEFRLGTSPILIATDLAQRGLDIHGVHTVVNFDAPDNIEAYVHRIGRTGRAGQEGRAVTFLTDRDRNKGSLVDDILAELGKSDQIVSDEFLQFVKGFGFGGPPSGPADYGSPVGYGAPASSSNADPVAAPAQSWGPGATSSASAAPAWGGSATAAPAAPAAPASTGWGQKPTASEGDGASAPSSNGTRRIVEPAPPAATSWGPQSAPKGPSPAPPSSGWGASSSSAAPTSAPAPAAEASPPSSPLAKEDDKAYDSGVGLSSPELGSTSPLRRVLNAHDEPRTPSPSGASSNATSGTSTPGTAPADIPVPASPPVEEGEKEGEVPDEKWLENFIAKHAAETGDGQGESGDGAVEEQRDEVDKVGEGVGAVKLAEETA